MPRRSNGMRGGGGGGRKRIASKDDIYSLLMQGENKRRKTKLEYTYAAAEGLSSIDVALGFAHGDFLFNNPPWEFPDEDAGGPGFGEDHVDGDDTVVEPGEVYDPPSAPPSGGDDIQEGGPPKNPPIIVPLPDKDPPKDGSGHLELIEDEASTGGVDFGNDPLEENPPPPKDPPEDPPKDNGGLTTTRPKLPNVQSDDQQRSRVRPLITTYLQTQKVKDAQGNEVTLAYNAERGTWHQVRLMNDRDDLFVFFGMLYEWKGASSGFGVDGWKPYDFYSERPGGGTSIYTQSPPKVAYHDDATGEMIYAASLPYTSEGGYGTVWLKKVGDNLYMRADGAHGGVYRYDSAFQALIPTDEGYLDERKDLLKMIGMSYGVDGTHEFMFNNFGDYIKAWTILHPTFRPLSKEQWKQVTPNVMALQWMSIEKGGDALAAFLANMALSEVAGTKEFAAWNIAIEMLFPDVAVGSPGSLAYFRDHEKYSLLSEDNKHGFKQLFELSYLFNDEDMQQMLQDGVQQELAVFVNLQKEIGKGQYDEDLNQSYLEAYLKLSQKLLIVLAGAGAEVPGAGGIVAFGDFSTSAVMTNIGFQVVRMALYQQFGIETSITTGGVVLSSLIEMIHGAGAVFDGATGGVSAGEFLWSVGLETEVGQVLTGRFYGGVEAGNFLIDMIPVFMKTGLRDVGTYLAEQIAATGLTATLELQTSEFSQLGVNMVRAMGGIADSVIDSVAESVLAQFGELLVNIGKDVIADLIGFVLEYGAAAIFAAGIVGVTGAVVSAALASILAAIGTAVSIGIAIYAIGQLIYAGYEVYKLHTHKEKIKGLNIELNTTLADFAEKAQSAKEMSEGEEGGFYSDLLAGYDQW